MTGTDEYGFLRISTETGADNANDLKSLLCRDIVNRKHQLRA